MSEYYLAVDLGASSGRLILGRRIAADNLRLRAGDGESGFSNGTIELEEVHRFSNRSVTRNGYLCWEHDRLFAEILAGMRKCREMGKIPVSMGVDTWGVDFVLLDGEGNIIGDTVAYRDSRTDDVDAQVAEIISDGEQYGRAGLQKMPFNTIYQLWTVRDQLPKAKSLLFTPEYLHYLLTGAAMSEYTIASTSGLVNARTKDWDFHIIQSLGYPRGLFGKLHFPGETVGSLSPEIAESVGFNCKVVLPPSHDTASAVAAAPLTDDSVYISSGTWSLLGVESVEPITTEESRIANFTNEGGVFGTIRYLKNIMGLWMIQELHRELEGKYSFDELDDMAESESAFPSVVDVSAVRYLAPESMSAEVRAECEETGQPVPDTPAKLARCIFHSLAAGYARAIVDLERITGRKYSRVCIVGGGCKDMHLNRLTAKETGRAVFAGPSEATALGNLAIQMIADGALGGIEEAREIIRNSPHITEVSV